MFTFPRAQSTARFAVRLQYERKLLICSPASDSEGFFSLMFWVSIIVTVSVRSKTSYDCVIDLRAALCVRDRKLLLYW
jgi:hypothetical protein